MTEAAVILQLLWSIGIAPRYEIMSVSGYSDVNGAPPWGYTADMTRTRRGICACGTEYSFGTIFIIDDRVFVCHDRGPAVKKRNLDLWFPTEWEALRWGRREMPVMIIQ